MANYLNTFFSFFFYFYPVPQFTCQKLYILLVKKVVILSVSLSSSSFFIGRPHRSQVVLVLVTEMSIEVTCIVITYVYHRLTMEVQLEQIRHHIHTVQHRVIHIVDAIYRYRSDIIYSISQDCTSGFHNYLSKFPLSDFQNFPIHNFRNFSLNFRKKFKFLIIFFLDFHEEKGRKLENFDV